MSVKLQMDESRNGRRSWFHPKTETRSIYVFILIYYLSKHPSVRMSPCFVDYSQTVTLWSRSSLLGLTVRLQKLTVARQEIISHITPTCLVYTSVFSGLHGRSVFVFPALPNFGTDLPRVSNRGGSSSMTRTCRR